MSICYSTIYNTIQLLGPKYFLLVKAWLKAWRCRSMDDITDSCSQIKLVQLANFMVLVIRKEIAFLMHLTCFLTMSHVSYVFQIIKKVPLKPTVVFSKILYWNIVLFSKNSKIYEKFKISIWAIHIIFDHLHCRSYHSMGQKEVDNQREMDIL